MEPTLALKKADYEEEIGFFLGYGRLPAYWTDDHKATIRACLNSGLRRFYYVSPEYGGPYEWSFLRPTATTTLTSATRAVALPDDFGTFDGPLLLLSSDRSYWPVPLTGFVRQKVFDSPETTGQPQYAVDEPLAQSSGQRGQRRQLVVWPLADQDYTLQFRYSLHPNALTDDRPYAYGGPAHGETIKEACLFAAEKDVDGVSEGPHSQDFRRCLLASMAFDARNKPRVIGYNGDDSHASRGWHGRRDRDAPGVTFDGTLYD